jgi:hypothetical protein
MASDISLEKVKPKLEIYILDLRQSQYDAGHGRWGSGHCQPELRVRLATGAAAPTLSSAFRFIPSLLPRFALRGPPEIGRQA